MSNFFHSIALLNPKGTIALAERNLMVTIFLIILIAVIPAYILLFTFARKYRASNRRLQPAHDNTSSKWVIFFWLFPSIIVLAIALTTWKTAHELDPYKAIASANPAIEIQVVALRWKWLFIYPAQHIATINFIEFPVNTPIHFDLTADAPMNSFWIPQLGSQIYSMPGMSTQLNLMATELGDFNGSAAEVNGQGFAGMKFIARSSTENNFNQWVANIQQGTTTLNLDTYNNLALPSEYNPVTYYSSIDQNMYNEIIEKFMPAMSSSTSSQDMNSMDMSSMNMTN